MTVEIGSLRGEFGEHFISRSGSINRAPSSYDLMALDYVMQGYVNSHIYTEKHDSIDLLVDNIETFIRGICTISSNKDFIRFSYFFFFNIFSYLPTTVTFQNKNKTQNTKQVL